MKKIALLAYVSIMLGSTGFSADFFCAYGNVGCLISAIEVSNGNDQDNSIFLAAGEYTLHTQIGTNPINGLPAITGRIRIIGPEGIGSTIDGGGGFRIFEIASGGNVMLDWLGIRHGQTRNSGSGELCGGAILNGGTLTINRSTIYNNNTNKHSGGAICNLGSLSISHSDFRSNFAGNDSGGAIYSSGAMDVEDSFFSGNASNFGSAIWSVGTGIMLRTTISGNRADEGAIRASGTFWIEDSSVARNTGSAISNLGTMTITNTTIFQNDGLSDGGGIFNSGNLLLKNSSVIANKSVGAAGGIRNLRTIRLQNSILAQNIRGSSPSDCSAITSLGNNIIGSLAGCSVALRSSDIVGDPGVGSFIEDVLVYGSGHVPLMPGSPAINHGNDGACSPRDQLGEPRRGICDIGAVEFQGIQKVEGSQN